MKERFPLIRFASFNADIDGSFGRKGREFKRSEEVARYGKLFRELQKAIKEEDYLKASKLRDEALELREIIINKRR
jgi:protein-arginine kinase activator protein McsA